MPIAALTSVSQVTLPIAVRTALGLVVGAKVVGPGPERSVGDSVIQIAGARGRAGRGTRSAGNEIQQSGKQITERGHKAADVSARLGVSQHRLYQWIRARQMSTDPHQAQGVLPPRPHDCSAAKLSRFQTLWFEADFVRFCRSGSDMRAFDLHAKLHC